MDRVIDRLPALLLFAVLLLLAHVAVFEARQPAKLLAGVPAFLLLLLYLRAGSGGGGGKARKRKGGDE
jgi:hypothetical protein